MVAITLNGEPRRFPEGTTVASLLEQLEVEPSRVAVELNRRIVRKAERDTTAIPDGATVEVVHFVGGG